jgi:hypothetical protein
LIDCFDLSQFPKSPHVKVTLYEETQLAKNFFQKLKSLCPTAKIIWIWGNHDMRVQKYLYREAGKLADFPQIDLEYLVGADVECIKQKKEDANFVNTYIKEGEFYIGHWNKVSKWGGYTPKGLVDSYGVSIIQSHTHRIGCHIRTFLDRIVRAYEIGCMCESSYAKNADWALGWMIIEEKDGVQSPYQISITDLGFVYHGVVYI